MARNTADFRVHKSVALRAMGGIGLRNFGRSAAAMLAICMLALSPCSSKTTTGTATPSAGSGTGKTIALGAVLSLTGAGGIYGPQQNRTPVTAPSNTRNRIVGTCPYSCTYIFRDSLGEAAAIPANLKVAVA